MTMKRNLFLLVCFACVASYMNCGSKAGFQVDDPEGDSYASGVLDGDNVMAIEVGVCGDVLNQPCVTVTVCEPDTDRCQQVDNVLLDTGSYGLRLFKSAVSLNLPASADGSGKAYGECMEYLDGSLQWGSVHKADIQLASLKAARVPVQLIDADFASVPSDCASGDATLQRSPDDTGFNGILGVGPLTEDCGPDCETKSNLGVYYACSGTSCAGTTIPVAQQVTNPVSKLPSDNNGFMIRLPAVPSGGADQVTGSLILGIGTRANNATAGMQAFAADDMADIPTAFNGASLSVAFIDSGSNGLFFPGKGVVAECTDSSLGGLFCPASLTDLSAVLKGLSGTPSATAPFQIQNTETIVQATETGKAVFNNFGGQYDDGFDWGLPFFFGRTIAFGLSGRSSPLGTGPYYAF